MLAEVSLVGGLRTLSVRSAVSLTNQTATLVEMSAHHPRSAEVARRSTHVLEPGSSHALPLLLTERGAEAAIWEVKLRPVLPKASAGCTTS